MADVMSVSRKRPGVVIYRSPDVTGDSHRFLADAGCRVRVIGEGEKLDRVLLGEGPVHAVLAATLRGETLDRSMLEILSELRIVAKYTIGVDDVDVRAATDLGILVTHCPTEANWGGVAEGTVALMLALLKKIEFRNKQVKAGGWRSDALFGTYIGARGDGYAGITIGIIGLGRIGRRVAGLLSPWRARLLATDPYVDPSEFVACGTERVDLDELLVRSDVVSVHCELTEETAGLIDRSRVGRMKPHALLINTARGRIVDLDAVCDALDADRLGGAALDVFPEEPLPADARISKFDERVILSPHMAAANTGGTLREAVPWATDAVLMALKGEVPPRVCNEAAIERWQSRFAGKSLLEPDLGG